MTTRDTPTLPAPRGPSRSASGTLGIAALAALLVLTVHARVDPSAAPVCFVGSEAPSPTHPFALDAVAAQDVAHVLAPPRAGADQPLARVAHRIVLETAGLDPARQRRAGVALHLVASLLLLGALRRARVPAGVAAFAALVYAVHPLTVEPVAWASQRGRLLAALLAAGALWLQAAERRVSAALVALLALASHPLALPLPLLLAGVELARPSADGRGRARRLASPLLVLAPGAAWLALAWRGASGVEVGFVERALAAPLGAARHALHALLPVRLSSTSPHPALLADGASGSAIWPEALAWLVALALGAGLARAALRRSHLALAAAGALWFLVASLGAELLPYGAALGADRGALLALPGLLVAVGAIAARALRARRAAAAALAALAVLALAVRARERVDDWRSADALARAAIAVDDEDPLAWRALGHDLLRRGRLSDAGDAFERALELRPGDRGAHHGLAAVALRHPDLARAERHLVAALEAAPGPERVGAELALFAGTLLLRKRDPASLEHAAEHLARAIRAAPRFVRARTRRAVTLVELGRLDEAHALARETLDLAPCAREAWLALGMAAELEGDPAAARDAYAEALACDGDYAEALVNLGRLQNDAGDLETSLATLERAFFLHPLFEPALYELARVYHAAGLMEEAGELYRRTLLQRRDHMRALVGLGWTHLARGNPGRASDLAQMALANNPAHPGALELLAHVARAAGEWETALVLARDAERGAPFGGGRAAARLVALLLAAAPDDAVRDPAAAVRRARALVEADGGDAGALRALAAAQAAAGRFDDAAATLERALALPPRPVVTAPPAPRDALERELALYRRGAPLVLEAGRGSD